MRCDSGLVTPREDFVINARRWLNLLVLSLLSGALLGWLHVPAASLLGPMVAAVVSAVRGGTVRFPRQMMMLSQAFVGVMMASHQPIGLLRDSMQQWPVFLVGTLLTLTVSMSLGWLLLRTRLLPGTTAIWGVSPGAAAAMTLMSEHFGADMRLVAFMQYLRVVSCTLVSALAVHYLGQGGSETTSDLFSVMHTDAYLVAFALAFAGLVVNQLWRVPGGALLLPLIFGLAVQLQGGLVFEVPGIVLVISFSLIGWNIGARFTPEVLLYAKRVFPIVFLSTLTLIGANALGALILVAWIDIDPLSAFLATSPGGADSVAIIASNSAVNIGFVMSMQILRFLVVVILGPLIARSISKRIDF